MTLRHFKTTSFKIRFTVWLTFKLFIFIDFPTSFSLTFPGYLTPLSHETLYKKTKHFFNNTTF